MSNEFAATARSVAAGHAPDEDAQLLARIAQRDAAALKTLYDRRASLLFALCQRILKDTMEAEEVLEDVFWEVWRRADRYTASRGAAISYLLTITRSRAIDRLRSRGKPANRVHSSDVAPDATPEFGIRPGGHVEPSANPSVDAQAEELRHAVREAVAKLPPAQRDALELAYFGGMTQTQIAQELSEPLGTIKTRIRCALVHLRTSLAKWIEVDSD